MFFGEQRDRRPTRIIRDRDGGFMTNRIAFSRCSRGMNWMFLIGIVGITPCPLRLRKLGAAAGWPTTAVRLRDPSAPGLALLVGWIEPLHSSRRCFTIGWWPAEER